MTTLDKAGDKAAPGAPAISVDGLHKSFGDLEVLGGIDLTVARGEVVCVIGPSGSGKSTLLRCVNMLEEPSAGRITVAGAEVTDPDVDIDRVRRRIGMVFQSFNLFPHLTVLDNLTIAQRRVLGRSRSAAEEVARANLVRVGLTDKEKSYPAQLSGGQQQRVAIARALANRPALIIADEPTGQLDAETGHAVMELLRAVVRGEDVTALVATHDAALLDLADRVLELRDGTITDHSEPGTAAEPPAP